MPMLKRWPPFVAKGIRCLYNVSVTIRNAQSDEIEWINARYDEVGFIHSDFKKELIAIAELDGERIGLGRLVKIAEDKLELGGVYVLASHRRRGVARKLVTFLLENAVENRAIYCIPFINLYEFYNSFGFVLCDGLENIPQHLIKKYEWCLLTYSEKTLLLELR